MPSDIARPLYAFGGWYTAQNGGGTEFTASTTVNGNITVYAKWIVLSFNDALASLNDNAIEGGAYTITLTRDEIIAPVTPSCGGKNVNVTIRGDAAKRTVNLSSSGSLFTVESGVTLTLDNNIALRGRSDNNASLVTVDNGGKLVMNAGSEISGNNTRYAGGGVFVYGDGTFTMNGGTISGNTATGGASPTYGGGVYVGGGTFTMSGGTINGNSISLDSGAGGGGGGVYVVSGTFTMSGGTISGNTAGTGGGVYVVGGTFTMSGGTFSGNTASSSGGGVYVDRGTFIKQVSGIIYGSNAGNTLKNTPTRGDSYGHAVWASSGKRNTTAGAGVMLDSAKAGSAGGWE
jgi:uncharacterized repeat protein (TIGR02543 family)